MASPTIDITDITGYVDQNSEELLSLAIAGSKSSQVLTIQTGVKGTSNIQTLDTGVTFQDDAFGFNASGVTTLSKVALTVTPLRVNEEIDMKGLNATYVQHQLKAGSKGEDSMPFEQVWLEQKSKKIASSLEQSIWQGDENTGTGNLAFFDGFCPKLVDATADTIKANADGVATEGQDVALGLGSAEIIDAVNDVYNSIPVELLQYDDNIIVMGHDKFRMYTQALVTANLFHYDGQSSDFEIVVPGTNVKVIALHGLNGIDTTPTNGTAGYPVIVAGRASNFVIGVDLEHDEDEFLLWYSQDDRVMKFAAAFKYGVAIAFPEEVVVWSLNADA